MKKSFVRALFAALAIAFALVLAACDDPATRITFRNSTEYDMETVCISSTSSDTWGSGISVKAGEEGTFNASELEDGNEVAYDFCSWDENSVLCEFYGVKIGEGYTIEQTVGGLLNPVIIVTDTNGNSVTYEGFSRVYLDMNS